MKVNRNNNCGFYLDLYDSTAPGASLPDRPVRWKDLGQEKQTEPFITGKSMLIGQIFVFLWNEQ